MKIKEIIDLLKDHDPEMDVLYLDTELGLMEVVSIFKQEVLFDKYETARSFHYNWDKVIGNQKIIKAIIMEGN